LEPRAIPLGSPLRLVSKSLQAAKCSSHLARHLGVSHKIGGGAAEASWLLYVMAFKQTGCICWGGGSPTRGTRDFAGCRIPPGGGEVLCPAAYGRHTAVASRTTECRGVGMFYLLCCTFYHQAVRRDSRLIT